jgi:signal transduction histidine kinase/predicted negative regulator of RcsB-dependent stress response
MHDFYSLITVRFCYFMPEGRMEKSITEMEIYIESLDDSIEKVDLLNEHSKALRAIDFEAALEASKKAEEIAERISYFNGLALSYWHSGISCRLLSKYDLAFQYFDSAHKIYEREKNAAGQAKILNSIGNIYSNLGNHKSAFQYLNQSLKILEDNNEPEPELEANILSNIGVMYQETGDYSSSLEYYLRCIQTYTNNDIEIPETILNNIGAVYENLNDYLTALEYYFQSLDLAEKKNNKFDKGYALVNIALVYGDLQQYDEALKYLTESLSVLQEIGHKQGESNALSSISSTYKGLKEFDKALEFQFKVLKLREEINDTSGKAQTLTDIGEIYYHKGSYPAAKKYFLDSLKLASEINSNIVETRNLIFLGKLLFEQNEADEAVVCLNKALKIAEDNNAKKDIFEVHKTLYEYFKKVGNAKNALKHHEIFYSIEKEIFNFESDKKLKALTIRHQLKISDDEKKLALKDKEIYKLRNVELVELNEKLIKVNEEKNDFLNITAHDLKNPLSGILNFSKRMQKLSDKMTPQDIFTYSMEIEKASVKMFELVTKILDISAIESGRRNFQKESLDPEILAQRVLLDNKQRADQKKIELIFENNSVKEIITDRMALRQILDNLVSNAIKFSPFDRKVYLRIYGENKVIIEVEDEGPGLTEKDKIKLFGKFNRLSAQPTAGENSTGLGLSIAKKLTEMLDGTIRCESEAGHGAKFIVEFPA